MEALESRSSEIVAAAMEYAAYGWRVVPLRDGKIPRVKSWQHEASDDEERIVAWWEQWPDSNLGVKLGPDSGIVDVECDSPEAEELLLKLFGSEPPVTPTFQSSRGKHRLFRWRPDLPSPDKANFKLGKLEVRTGNGDKGAQSVFPPSVHASGHAYRWLVHPSECPVAEFTPEAFAALWNATPEDLLNESVGSPSGADPIERARKYLAKLPAAVSGQGGHNQTFRAACVLVLGFNLSVDQAWPLLEEYNGRCDPPWTDAELRHKLEDADKQTAQRGYLLGRQAPQDVSGKVVAVLADLRDPFNAESVSRAWELVDAWNKDARGTSPDSLRSTFDIALEAVRCQARNAAAAAGGSAPVATKPASEPPPDWRLVIVESRPRVYRLFSPLWSTKTQHGYIQLTAAQMHNAEAIRREALEQADVWVNRLFNKLWEGDKENESLARLLIEAARYEAAPLETKRDLTVAELLYETVAKAKPRDEPDIQFGNAARLPDGSIAFKFRAVWEPMAKSEIKVTQAELSAVLATVGAADKVLGPASCRRRWKVLEERSVDALRKLVDICE